MRVRSADLVMTLVAERIVRNEMVVELTGPEAPPSLVVTSERAAAAAADATLAAERAERGKDKMALLVWCGHMCMGVQQCRAWGCKTLSMGLRGRTLGSCWG